MTLLDETVTGPDITLTVQTPATYPARMGVALSLVIHVVEHFYRTGFLAEDVNWEP